MTTETKAKWELAVRRWRASGLTAQEFSLRDGINVSTLRWWSSRLGRPEALPEFVEIQMVPPAMAQPYMVILRDGLRIEVPETFNADALRRLVDALAGR